MITKENHPIENTLKLHAETSMKLTNEKIKARRKCSKMIYLYEVKKSHKAKYRTVGAKNFLKERKVTIKATFIGMWGICNSGRKRR